MLNGRAPLSGLTIAAPNQDMLRVCGRYLINCLSMAAGARQPVSQPPGQSRHGGSFRRSPCCDAKDVNLAVESAQRAWESGWRDLAPAKREAILHAVARKLRENLEEIAELEMLQIGKPISDARDEAGLGARVFEYYAGAVTKFCGQTIPVGRGGFDFTSGSRWASWPALCPGIFHSQLAAGKRRPRWPRATVSCSSPHPCRL